MLGTVCTSISPASAASVRLYQGEDPGFAVYRHAKEVIKGESEVTAILRRVVPRRAYNVRGLHERTKTFTGSASQHNASAAKNTGWRAHR